MVTIAFDDPPPERNGRSSSPRNPRRQATRRVLAAWPDGFLLAAPWGTAASPPAPALNRGSTAGLQPRDLLPPGMLLPEAKYFTDLPVRDRRLVSDERPPVRILAVRELPHSGKPAELLAAAGIDAEAIAAAARSLVGSRTPA